MIDPTQRFSSRVENYIRYRPSYPDAVIEALVSEGRLAPASVVADIGSGTGVLAELFLRHGNRVYGVEPNDEMRHAGERLLRGYPQFQSVAGRAEATTLAPHSVDWIVAGQAFHWFDRERARDEFTRILKPPGSVMLVWNERETCRTPFLVAYEALLRRFAIDYAEVNHQRIDERVLADFYGGTGFRAKTFSNRQDFDHDGVRGRLLSSSYAPERGHPNHEPMLTELARIFAAHQVNGQVTFDYSTRMYYGRLG